MREGPTAVPESSITEGNLSQPAPNEKPLFRANPARLALSTLGKAIKVRYHRGFTDLQTPPLTRRRGGSPRSEPLMKAKQRAAASPFEPSPGAEV